MDPKLFKSDSIGEFNIKPALGCTTLTINLSYNLKRYKKKLVKKYRTLLFHHMRKTLGAKNTRMSLWKSLRIYRNLLYYYISIFGPLNKFGRKIAVVYTVVVHTHTFKTV